MDELTDALRRTLTDPRRELAAHADPVGDVHRGIRRRRARRTAAAGASLVLVAAATGTALALAPGEQAVRAPVGDGTTMVASPPAEPSPEAGAPSPASSRDPAPVFPADTDDDVGGPEVPGNGLSVVGARVARQDGFDRVVYELDGTGEVAWRVGYVDEAREQGSGEQIPLEGRSRLSVTILGVGYPTDTGVPQYDGPRRLAGTGTANVVEVWLGSVYEAQYDSYVALAGERRPFRVFSLSNPTRLVIDVRDR